MMYSHSHPRQQSLTIPGSEIEPSRGLRVEMSLHSHVDTCTYSSYIMQGAVLGDETKSSALEVSTSSVV
jgi:hypothetical protein